MIKKLLMGTARATLFPLMDSYVVERLIPLLQQRMIKNTRNQQLILGSQITAKYIVEHMSSCPVVKTRLEGLLNALKSAAVDGLILEFGVYRGQSINLLAMNAPERTVYGFDSFEGLPEAWHTGYAKGAFAETELRPAVRDNVELNAGWFDETLPGFLTSHPGSVSLLHIDSDLYSSAKYVLDALSDRIKSGTIIVFDEYFNYPGWEAHEYKAFQEFVQKRELAYEYISYTLEYTQVVVKII